MGENWEQTGWKEIVYTCLSSRMTGMSAHILEADAYYRAHNVR